jgi:hypothetical protein
LPYHRDEINLKISPILNRLSKNDDNTEATIKNRYPANQFAKYREMIAKTKVTPAKAISFKRKI